MHKILSGLIIVFLVISGFFISVQISFSIEPSKIIVDTSITKEELPFVFKTGMYLWFFPSAQHRDSLKRFFNENKLGVIKIPLDVNVFIPSRNMEDLKNRLTEVDPFVVNVKKLGGKVSVLIHGMPRWLSSNPSHEPAGHGLSGTKANFSPPRDYKEWSNLVKVIVNHFNNELKLDAFYIIWSEPNWDSWLGTEEEYFKLYKYSVIGAKSADPKAKVGGPGVSSWNSEKVPAKGRYIGKPLLENFLSYCGSQGLSEVNLTKIPVDFVEFHAFNVHPKMWNIMVSDVKNWLEKAHYSPETPLFVGEWASWEGPSVTSNPYSSKDHDTEFASSYIIASLAAMNDAGINYHTFTTLFDVGQDKEKEFTGNFGIFTRHGITKASYNAFKMLSMFEGKSIKAEEADPFIFSIATRSRDKIFLAVSNFIPTIKMYRPLIAEELRRKGYSNEELKSNKEEILKFIQNDLKGRIISSPNLTTDLKEISKKYNIDEQSVKYRRATPVDVEILFKNLPQKQYRIQEYLIDADHANAYTAQNKAERFLKREGGWKTLNIDSVNNNRNVAFEKVREVASKGGISPLTHKVALNPYGVMLIIAE